MVLDLINQYKDQYKEFLASNPDEAMFSAWESLKIFQDNWDLDTDDFKSMYAASFANTLTNDLWEGQSFFPKKAMLTFIDRDPDLVRTMFKELFNENLDIEGRIDRFVYHCDEIRRDIMRSNPNYQSHYHEGYRMISVYLAFRYPMQYTIYSYPGFKGFMVLVKARAVPDTNDIDWFFKVIRTVYGIISKNEELLEMSRGLRVGRGDLYQGESLFLVRVFLFLGGASLA